MDGRNFKRGGGGWEVSRKETFKVRTKSGEVSRNKVRSICFGLGKVTNDMKCPKGQRRKLKSEARWLDLIIRKSLCHLREVL